MNATSPEARLPRPLAVALLGLLPACMSPEEYRLAADAETYALIDGRRRELLSEPAGFSIDPRPDSLRQRILAGTWDREHVYTLTELLEIAAENSRDYQTRKERLYLTALDLTLEQWQFGFRPFATLDGSATGVGGRTADAEFDGDLGFTKLLGSGATIVADIGAQLFRSLARGDGWDAVSTIGLAFTQPLLRGAGRRIVREPLTQAERDLVYEVRAFERFRRAFAVDVAERVYDLLQTADEVANEEQNYANLLDLRVRNDAMVVAGRMSTIQADEAKQDELTSENRLIVLHADLERQRDQFNLFLGLPVEVDLQLDPQEFTRLSDTDPLLDGLSEGPAVEFALEQRLDHLTVRDTLEDQERRVFIAEDGLRAGLSLDASANSATEEGRPVSHRIADARWSLGFSLDLPADRKAERNAYRRSLIALEAAKRTFEEDSDRIRAAVRDAIRIARNARESYVIQEGAVTLAERRVESARLNLDAGRGDTLDVLRAVESLVNSRNAATGALIRFTLARLDLHLQLELLRVDQAGIRIEEDLASRLIEPD